MRTPLFLRFLWSVAGLLWALWRRLFPRRRRPARLITNTRTWSR